MVVKEVLKAVEGSGTTQTVLLQGIRETIQTIKEIVGKNHSDADIYVALKETNMDPNETTQKLLNQDPFHEVRRKRDKKKENARYNGPANPRKIPENVCQGTNYNALPDRSNRRSGGFVRNSFPGRSREFRVVRDNRVNQTTNKEVKPPLQQSTASASEHVISSVLDKGFSSVAAHSQKSGGGRSSFQVLNGPVDSHHLRHTRGANASANDTKVLLEERRGLMHNMNSRTQTGKSNDSRPSSAGRTSSHSVLGVYSSSSDPVHVPSGSRSSAVGTFRREVGVVGGRRHSSDNAGKHLPGSSFSQTSSGRDNNLSTESFRPFNAFAKSNQLGQNTAPAVVMPSMSATRPFSSNQHGNRSHQPPVGHHKGAQPNKEWKPKSSQKSGVISPGVIGPFAKSVSPPVEMPSDCSKNSKEEEANLQEDLLHANTDENQSVFIAEHIRVTETDRCRLTFGSFGQEVNSSEVHVTGLQAASTAVESGGDPSASLSVPALESSGGNVTGRDSPESLGSGVASEHQFSDKKESSSPQNLDIYTDIIRVHNNSSSDTPSESHQQEPPELPNFSAYDLQTGYDIPYFRPAFDETARVQGPASSQEVLISHTANSVPGSTMAMLQQQQQQQVAQMYPQVHVSHFANLMPYRQFLSPVYVPPMAMPGYSSNPAYPHPSNGNSFLLMPGGSSHLNMNGLKYGVQQFKPVPTGSPTGFGNFNNPTGYAINAPGAVGGPTGLDEPSRLKYKDGNLYVPNPQAESSEIWIQNPRELQGLQSPPYYNMSGQPPHAAAYLPSHTGHHASFNAAAAAQSSHMQFPGLYHPSPQPTALANPHHMAPAIGANIGVGVAPAAPVAQVGSYQQPQLGHLNWTTNF